MNRLSAAPSPPATTAAVARAIRPALRSPLLAGPPPCLLSRHHYERNDSYTRLVWLHSAGGDEHEIHRIMPLVSLRNYASLGVRGPVRERRGYWWPQTSAGIAAAEQAVLEAVARAKQRFNI